MSKVQDVWKERRIAIDRPGVRSNHLQEEPVWPISSGRGPSPGTKATVAVKIVGEGVAFLTWKWGPTRKPEILLK